MKSTHPFLRCQAHWQNAQSQRYDQILPKSLPARPTTKHGEKDSAAKMKDKMTRKINNETPTKCICHKGFSGYSSVVARSNFLVSGQETARNPLLHLASTVMLQAKNDD